MLLDHGQPQDQGDPFGVTFYDYVICGGKEVGIESYAQPILLTLLTLMVPATARFLWASLSKKLDEGRSIAEARAHSVEMLLKAYQLESENIAAVRHRDNVERFDRLEIQTSSTNGKVAEHDKMITILTTQNEMLIKLTGNGAKQ